ncbi:hypothetical protein D0962_35785 [Leptolyngbyaceae cyanobacterium CCMR0082]|uniref:Uncharacterized protein n=1 Tax=Adonisia turfae CCMR0082 TaxID=2304604 RepID=A0A6M0SI66_9CYAN|nr:hypothetical protein [Adonisia turfae CCMR0082]
MVGYQVRVRRVYFGPGRFAVSVPVVVPDGQVLLCVGQCGGECGCGLRFTSRLKLPLPQKSPHQSAEA